MIYIATEDSEEIEKAVEFWFLIEEERRECDICKDVKTLLTGEIPNSLFWKHACLNCRESRWNQKIRGFETREEAEDFILIRRL